MKRNLFTKAIQYIVDGNYRTRLNIGLGIYDRMPDGDFLKMAFGYLVAKERERRISNEN